MHMKNIIEHRLQVIENLLCELVERVPDGTSSNKETAPDKWLTRDEVRQRFHISFPTILKFEKEGVIKGYRMGRRVLFLKTEIENKLKGRVTR